MGFELRCGLLCGVFSGVVLSCLAIRLGATPLEVISASLVAAFAFAVLCALLRRRLIISEEASETQGFFTAAFASTGIFALLTALTLKLSHALDTDMIGASIISAFILASYLTAACTFMRSAGRSSMLRRSKVPVMRRVSPPPYEQESSAPLIFGKLRMH
jgi:hypothetical protein